MAGYIADDNGQPARPYDGPDSLGGNAPRTAELFHGALGNIDDRAPGSSGDDAGLSLSSQQFNSQVPGRARATSVLQPLGKNPGGNGMSAGDAARRTIDGTYLGSVNGTSQSSFEPAAWLRLSGQDSE
jgi:hypothetical protein